MKNSCNKHFCYYDKIDFIVKCNSSELQKADVIGHFRQTTCSASASIHYSTLKVRKIYSYNDSWKNVKMLIVHQASTKLALVITLFISQKPYCLLLCQF